MNNLYVLKISILVLIIIGLSTCKEKEYVCSYESAYFLEYKYGVRIIDFTNESDYIDYVDSMKQIYGIEKLDVNFVSFKESNRDKYKDLFDTFGWYCQILERKWKE